MGDNQRRVEFGIFQGEAREVSGNVRLGGLDIAVPPRPAGEVQVDVRFSYDSSGLLEVDVSIPLTGESRNVVFVDEEDRKDAAELDRRRRALAAIKVHPREEAANQALLARAERMWEDHLGDVREAIGHWIIAFQTALESQDHRTIAQASADLAMRLDSLDAEMPL
jgi:molecular chaperone HscC